jgi:hypothetical protein
MVGVSRFHYHHYFLFRFVLENHRMVASVDFTVLNGTFGQVNGVAATPPLFAVLVAQVQRMAFFCPELAPSVILSLGIAVTEGLGGLRAAQQLMTPILKPLLGIPGICSLALIANLQNTDAAAGMTKEMADDGTITDREGYFRHLPDQRQRHYYQLLLIRYCTVYQYHGSGDYSWSLSLF